MYREGFGIKRKQQSVRMISGLLLIFGFVYLKDIHRIHGKIQLAGYEFSDLTILRIEQGSRFVPDYEVVRPELFGTYVVRFAIL